MMKQSIFFSTVIGFLILLVPLNTGAQERLSKQIKKSYTFDAKGSLSVDNKYGDIYLEGWDKDSIAIEINVVSIGKSAATAQELLDRIQPSIIRQGLKVSVSSNIIKKEPSLFNKLIKKIGSGKAENADSQIDYMIYLPRNVEVTLVNKYGDIVVSNWDGVLNANVEHGDIRLPEELEQSVLSIKYGKLKANSLTRSRIISSDANVDINIARTLEVESKGTEVHLGEIEFLRLKSNKDEFEIELVDRLEGDVKYSTVEVNALGSDTNLQLKLAEFRALDFQSEGPTVRIDQENSEVYFNISNTSFQFDATLEQGVLRIPKTFQNIDSKMLDNNRKIRNIRATYGRDAKSVFSFTGVKGLVILKEL